MKIIDLLNKIANGEEVPKKIIFKHYRYHKHPEGYFRSVINSNWIALTTDFNIYDILNDEVEILEEKKKIPEKLEIYKIADKTISGLRKSINVLNEDIANKTNEIIDYLKSKGE